MHRIQSKYKHKISRPMSMNYQGDKRCKLSAKTKKNANNVSSVSTFRCIYFFYISLPGIFYVYILVEINAYMHVLSTDYSWRSINFSCR